MKTKISVAIAVHNEEKNLPRVLASVKDWADEVVVADGNSSDSSVEVAKKLGAKVIKAKHEPMFHKNKQKAIDACKNEWVLLLDADEEVSKELRQEVGEVLNHQSSIINHQASGYWAPRKNIIFGKWMENTRWWPDYIPRFFKKGRVNWPKQIHRQPELKGNIYTLPDDKDSAIVHYHYDSLDQFLSRAMRYSEVQAEELIKEKKYKLSSSDLILKPAGEFFSRFFVGEGYKDGFHGLALAVLQSYATALIYLKVWEKRKYEKRALEPKKLKSTFSKLVYETDYWQSRWWLDRTQGYQKIILGWFYRIRGLILKLF